MSDRYVKWKFYLCILPIFLLAVIESLGSVANLVRERLLSWCLKAYEETGFAEDQTDPETEYRGKEDNGESFFTMPAAERLSWLARISWKIKQISKLTPGSWQTPVFILLLIFTFLASMIGTDTIIESLLDIKK